MKNVYKHSILEKEENADKILDKKYIKFLYMLLNIII